MSIIPAVTIAIYVAVAVAILATLIVQEALLPEPDWKSFWFPALGAICWGPIFLLCVVILVDDAFRGRSLSRRA